MAETSTARTYWAYHLSKFSFFTVNGALGYFLALSQRQASASSAQEQQQQSAGFMASPIQEPLKFLSFRFDEAMETFHQDLANIEAKLYKLPWDMDMGLAHRQASPLYILDKSTRSGLGAPSRL